MAAAKKPQLPKKLRIGYAVYDVIANKAADQVLIEEGLAGASNGNLARIVVRTDLPPLGRRETLLHEVLHQCLFVAGQENSQKVEEPIVRAMAMQLIAALRDNPALVTYLTSQE